MIKRYRIALLLLAAMAALGLFKPGLASRSFHHTGEAVVEMMMVIPPIFILLGIFDVWVPRQTIIGLMGDESGAKGVVLALFLGSFAAGPLYAAFPVATLLLKKGARFANIMIFTGAWATTKVPMLLFEGSSMGWPFALTRLAVNLSGIVLIAQIMAKMGPKTGPMGSISNPQGGI